MMGGKNLGFMKSLAPPLVLAHRQPTHPRPHHHHTLLKIRTGGRSYSIFTNFVSSIVNPPPAAKAQLDPRRPWRDAASVILVAPAPSTSNDQSPNFLVMKRSDGSAFAPSTLCFPGGTVHQTDADAHWIRIFMLYTGGDPSKATFLAPSARQPLVYVPRKPPRTPDTTREELQTQFRTILPPEVALRICAIRELFEECGILLARNNDKEEGRAYIGRENKLLGIGYTTNPIPFQDPNVLEEWQDKVRRDPQKFLEMCVDLHVRPDINALVEWSNWLTPNSFPTTRFDTVFYMALIPSTVPFLQDEREVASLRWTTAGDVLKGAATGKARLLPPQIYELTRLQNATIEKLKKLMKMRLQLGITRLCPCYIKATDGIISLFPGDDLYPPDYRIEKFEEIREIPSTLEELRNNSKNHHRIQFRSPQDFDLLVNISPTHGNIYL